MATKSVLQPPAAGSASIVGGAGGTQLLPKNISQEWWKKATEQSIIPTLSKSTPVIIGDGNVVPVLTKRPSASIIGELQNKVDSELEVGAKNFKTIKAEVGLEFSLETILTNPAGILDIIGEEMSGALARQVDAAVIHNRQSSNGAQLTSGTVSITAGAPTVELPLTAGVGRAWPWRRRRPTRCRCRWRLPVLPPTPCLRGAPKCWGPGLPAISTCVPWPCWCWARGAAFA